MNPFYVVPIAIPVFLVLVMFVLSKIIWSDLLPYRMPDDQERVIITTGSLYVGSSHYTNCIRVSVHPEGIGLCPMIPFRLFHPPVCMPWSSIHHIDSVRTIFGKGVAISFDSGERKRLVIRRSVYEQSILPMMRQVKEKASL